MILTRCEAVVKNKLVKIELTGKPIDKIPAQAIVSGLFLRDIPLKGHLGMLDWRLYGFFSQLLEESKLTGKFRETYLVPTKKKALASHVLILGLGQKKGFDEKKIRELTPFVLKSLRRLKIQELVMVPLGWEVFGYTKAIKFFLQEFHRNEPLFPDLYFKKIIFYIPPEAKQAKPHLAKLLPFIQKKITYA